MPETGRVILPRHPYRFVQRGRNRHTAFIEADDRCRYRPFVRRAS